jgi:DNA-binding SARP family transcriptional activator
LATDARYEAAELALNLGRLEQARVLNEEVLRADPFREGAWRLAMRIADGLGDEKAVLRAYLQCEQTFAELGASPAPGTKEFLGHLRR